MEGIVIICDLCGEEKECQQREIEGMEYDICSECWRPVAQKLAGKGRKIRETVLLPPRTIKEPEEKARPLPGASPKIFGVWLRAQSQCFPSNCEPVRKREGSE